MRLKFHCLVVASISVITIAAFLPGISGPFLFDDVPNITENTLLSGPKASLMQWWAAAQSSGAGILRRPLPMLSFALQMTSGPPDSALAMKFLNVIIHCATGALIYVVTLLLQRSLSDQQRVEVSRDDWYLPALVASVWMLNPLLLSTVLYPVQRMAQLSAFFVAAGLTIFVYYRQRWVRDGVEIGECCALVLWLLFFGILAVSSKENGLLLFWLVTLLEFFFFRGYMEGRQVRWVKLLGVVLFCLPFFLLAILLVWKWDWIVRGFDVRDFTLSERMWTQLRVLWSYATAFAVPRIGEYGLFHDDVMISRGWLSPVTTLGAALTWVSVIVLAWVYRIRYPWVICGLLFFLVAHSMESSVLALEMVFEHRNYLPTVGLAMAVAALLSLAAEKLSHRGLPVLATTVPIVYLFVLAATLVLRASGWSSEFTLATASVSRHPESARSTHFYANTLIKEGDETTAQDSNHLLTLARHEFEALHKRDPNDLSALVMLFTLDSQYFVEVATPERWLLAIEQRVQRGALLPTEFAAMRVLFACIQRGDCAMSQERLERLLTKYFERVPLSVSIPMQLERTDPTIVGAAQRVAILTNATNQHPAELSFYYPLIGAYLQLGDYAGAHQTIIRMLKQDGSRRHLAAIDGLFNSAGPIN